MPVPHTSDTSPCPVTMGGLTSMTQDEAVRASTGKTIDELQDSFHALVKMKPGTERQKAILDWLAGSEKPGATNKIPVNGRMQLSVRDPDLAHLLKKGLLKREHYGGRGSKYARFGLKDQVFVSRT